MAAQPTSNSHFSELLMLAILHVSAWACLIRSDFNFVFVLFCYFIFVSNREEFVVTVVFYMTVVLIVLDLLFFMFVPKTWMSEEENNTIWNGMKGLRGFAIFLSVLGLILKGPLIFFLWRFRQEVKKGYSPNLLPQGGL